MEGEWPRAVGVPVALNIRPARHRGRTHTDRAHRSTVYYQDANGLLIPAVGSDGLNRSQSAAAARRPTQIFINNTQYEDRSPVRDPHEHGHRHIHYEDCDEEEWEEPAHSPRGKRRPSKDPASRNPSPYIDYEMEKKLKKLEELEMKEKEDAARERYEEELIIKEAKRVKKQKEDEELKQKAIEEYHIKELEEKAKKEAEKQKADEEFKERVKKTFGLAGYDEESIAKVLKKGEKKEGHGHGHGKKKQIMDLTRPTYIKVHRKHISTETLDEYDLPWEWDEVSCTHQGSPCLDSY